MIPLNGWTVAAIGVLLVLAGLTIVYLLIETRHEREGAALFTSALPAETWPAELPEPAPFPGDEPAFLPAPADGPEPDDSTLWNLHKIEPGQVWERLRAEEAEEALS